jgi:hypothetical protein
METIISEKYKVGGYVFEDKDLALKLDKLLSEGKGKVICPDCKGTCVVDKIESGYHYESDGIVSRIVKSECSTCNDGTLTKITEVRYVK